MMNERGLLLESSTLRLPLRTLFLYARKVLQSIVSTTEERMKPSQVDEIRAGSYRTRDHPCMIMQQMFSVMQYKLILQTKIMNL